MGGAIVRGSGIGRFRLGPPFGTVAHDQAGPQVDDLFADVGAVVGHALQRLDDRHESECELHTELPQCDLLLCMEHDLALEALDGVVEEQDLPRQSRILGVKLATAA